MATNDANCLKYLFLFAMISSAHAQTAMKCDETKCTSPSMYALIPDVKGPGPYDCWANGASEPYSCVSGYTGQPVPGVPAVGDYKYYTCCQPGFTAADVVQDCDTTTFPVGSSAGSCTSPSDKTGLNKDCITCGESRTCAGTYSNPRGQPGSFTAGGMKCSFYLCCKTSHGNTVSVNLWLCLLSLVSIVVAM